MITRNFTKIAKQMWHDSKPTCKLFLITVGRKKVKYFYHLWFRWLLACKITCNIGLSMSRHIQNNKYKYWM